MSRQRHPVRLSTNVSIVLETYEKSQPTSLAPIRDSYTPGCWVVYMRKTVAGSFLIYVDKNYFRRFSLSDMPHAIKEKLVLIHSIPHENLHQKGDWKNYEELMDVGWRIDDEWYHLVISENLLNELKGNRKMPLTSGKPQADVEVRDDTGRASQEAREGDTG